MPSRAVARKKARREAKKAKTASSPLERPGVYYNGNAPEQRRDTLRLEQPFDDGQATVVPARYQVPPPPKRTPKAVARVFVKVLSAAPSRGAPVVGNEESAPVGAARMDTSDVQVESEESATLTHKQRKKLQAKLRLEKQMERLQAHAERARTQEPAAGVLVETEGGTAGDAPDVTADVEHSAEGQAPAAQPAARPTPAIAEGPKERHDPRFINGTFWRDRKEKRARTLFLGGLPSHFTVQHVKDYVATVVDTDPGAVDYLAQLEPGTPIVEEVDLLKGKHEGKVQHMYVTMASVPIAFIASRKLDGLRMGMRSLRCNFAADKSQRAEAIRRRGPELNGGHRGPGGGGGRGGGARAVRRGGSGGFSGSFAAPSGRGAVPAGNRSAL